MERPRITNMKTSKQQAKDRRLKNNAIAQLAREKMDHHRDNMDNRGSIIMIQKRLDSAAAAIDSERSKRREAEDNLYWIAHTRMNTQDFDKCREINVCVRVPGKFDITSFAERAIVSALRGLFNRAMDEAADLRLISLKNRLKILPGSTLEHLKYKFACTFKPKDTMGFPIPSSCFMEIFDAAYEAIREAASKVDTSKFPEVSKR